MKKHFKTTGIILKRMNFNEADQIVTMLTKEFGKLSFLVKSSRKFNSKFCGKLEPTSEIALEGYEGKSLQYLREAEVIRYPQDSNLKMKGILFFMMEVIYKLIPEHQEVDGVYDLLNESLQKITSSNNKKDIILYSFLVKLLTELGFMATWDHCTHSNQKINLKQSVYLSEEASLSHQADPLARNISPTLIKWINFMQKYPIDDIIKVNPDIEHMSQSWEILSDQLRRLLSSPLKSEVFLGQLS